MVLLEGLSGVNGFTRGVIRGYMVLLEGLSGVNGIKRGVTRG